MKVLFVKTSIGTLIESTIDLGIASISAVLKKNKHKTSYYLVSNWESLQELFYRINNFNPQVICFASTESTSKNINKIANILKKKYPDKFFVCGGVHIILSPESYIKNKNFDAICLGEGEYSLSNLLNNLHKDNDAYRYTKGFWIRYKNNIIKNEKEETIANINLLPCPDREIFSKENLLFNSYVGEGKNKTLEFIFSRGCPYNCSYCSNHALKAIYGKNYVRFRSPSKAIQEIKNTLNKYKPEYLVFHDDSFTINKNWLNEFLEKYKKDINIPFRCNTRVDLCSQEIFKNLKKSGCECIQFGLESGDSDLRSSVLNRHMSDDLIIKSFKLAKHCKIRTGAFVMIGLPDETPKKFIKTIKLVAKTDTDKYYLYVFRPYKSTKLYDYCKKFGFIQKPKTNFTEWQDSMLNLPNFSKKDIIFYYNNFDFLINRYRQCLVKSKSRWLKIIIFNLYCVPPSKKILFLFSQLLGKFLFNQLNRKIF